jgi:hypothetical protein
VLYQWNLWYNFCINDIYDFIDAAHWYRSYAIDFIDAAHWYRSHTIDFIDAAHWYRSYVIDFIDTEVMPYNGITSVSMCCINEIYGVTSVSILSMVQNFCINEI